MRIGEVSELVGISRSAIRFYERHGLINTKNINRSENGYREYQQKDVEEIRLIVRFKEVGLELNDIKVLLASESEKCGDLVSRLDEQVEKCRQMESLITARISSLLVAKENCLSSCSPNNRIRKCCA